MPSSGHIRQKANLTNLRYRQPFVNQKWGSVHPFGSARKLAETSRMCLAGAGTGPPSAARSVPLRTLYVTPSARHTSTPGGSGNLAICNLAIAVLLNCQITDCRIARFPGVSRRREWPFCSPASGTSRTRPSDTVAAGAGAKAGASRGTPRASGPSACRPSAGA
jgi:hypothetical protein